MPSLKMANTSPPTPIARHAAQTLYKFGNKPCPPTDRILMKNPMRLIARSESIVLGADDKDEARHFADGAQAIAPI